MSEDWPSSRRYIIGSVLNWAMFLAVIALLSWGDATGKLPEGAQWLLVLLLTASVVAQFVVAYRSIAAEDEFVRALTFKCGIAAAGVTISGAVLWGLAEQFLAAPKVPMWVVYPFFWGAFGMVSPFIRSSRT